jgi:TPR repeat protein
MQLVALHHGEAASNISCMYNLGTGGVARSKRRALQWRRKAADKGVVDSCARLARDMYRDMPHAREVGLVEVEATGVTMSAADMEGHDVPAEVLKSVVYWLQKWCVTGGPTPLDYLEAEEGRRRSGGGGCVLRQRRVRGRGPSEGLQGVPAVQDRPVLLRCVPKTGLE